jgi:ATP-dependent helicase/nuclease subunit B
LITNDRDGDYSALISFLGEPAGFIPKPEITPINDWEWWLTRKDIHYGADSVHSVYRHVLRGDTAETQRDLEVLTEYDGWVPSSAGAMDPLKNDVALSCSRLENLAKCPFAFFIRHVLGIEPLAHAAR